MTILSELNSQISFNKLRLMLIATPLVVGSGIYLYYHYRKSGAEPAINKKKAKNILSKEIELKNNGNECFRQGKYEEALKLYNYAIQACPIDKIKDLSTFFQNRAACYEHMEQYDNVVSDCSKAIEYDKSYVKAYLRRGKANVKLEKYEDASFDFYVIACSTQFQNSDYLKLLYEVLEKFSYGKAEEVVNKRKTYSFQSYLFRHVINKLSRDPLKAKSSTYLQNYSSIISKLLNDDCNDDELDLDQQLLKGTIEMFIGKGKFGAVRLRKIVETTENNDYKVNCLVKLAEFNFQKNKLDLAEELLKEAEQIDASNPDLYYIRSQLYIINKNYEAAINELDKAIELEPNFACAIGQKLYIEFQKSTMLNDLITRNRVMKEFDQAVNKFTTSNELILLYFQILLSSNDSKKAEIFINKALENDPSDPTLYVYRALIHIEEGDLEKTREFLNQALEIDSKCSFAYEMLADLCAKLENIKDALSYLESAINCSTTFEDVKNLILKHKTLELQTKVPNFS